MRTERISAPLIIQKPDKNNTQTMQKQTAKAASLLAASMLALATMGKAEVEEPIDPYDLSYESVIEFDKDYFRKYVNSYPELKRFSRVDYDTLRVINEADAVIDHTISNGVHDSKIIGYAHIANLYPLGLHIPLKDQKYDNYQYYKTKKAIDKTVEYAWPLPLAIAIFLFAKSKKDDFELEDYNTQSEAYGTKHIDLDNDDDIIS